MKYLLTEQNFVPDIVNPTPDYYCTWQTQLYATSDGKPEKQRAAIGEQALFGDQKPYGWAHFYEQARRDLILVMENGKIELMGTHDELLRTSVIYREVYEQQTNGGDDNE